MLLREIHKVFSFENPVFLLLNLQSSVSFEILQGENINGMGLSLRTNKR